METTMYCWETYRCLEAVHLYCQDHFFGIRIDHKFSIWLCRRMLQRMERKAAARKAQEELIRTRNMEY